MSGDFPREVKSKVAMQVFTPSKVVDISANSFVWTPEANDRVFCATEEFSSVVLTIDGVAQAAIRIPDFLPMGITENTTYTFTTNGTDLIAVM